MLVQSRGKSRQAEVKSEEDLHYEKQSGRYRKSWWRTEREVVRRKRSLASRKKEELGKERGSSSSAFASAKSSSRNGEKYSDATYKHAHQRMV
jgi:hypothetical protein